MFAVLMFALIAVLLVAAWPKAPKPAPVDYSTRAAVAIDFALCAMDDAREARAEDLYEVALEAGPRCGPNPFTQAEIDQYN